MVDKAVRAAAGLEPHEGCADAKALLARIPPPKDTATRERVEDIREKLARADALRRAGKFAESLAVVKEQVEPAQVAGHLPLQAEVLELSGLVNERLSAYEEAAGNLKEATYLADIVGDDPGRLRAANELVYLLGYRLNRFAEAELFVRLGEAAILRSGEEGLQKARWHSIRGVLRWQQGAYERALEDDKIALAILEKALGPEHPELAQYLNSMGSTLFSLNEFDRALETYRRALQIWERSLGTQHPEVAMVLNNMGSVLIEKGDYAQARQYLSRSLKIYTESLGPDHPKVALTLNNLGEASMHVGEVEAAVADLMRALAIREKVFGPEHPSVATVLGNLGELYLERGDLVKAVTFGGRAVLVWEKTFGPDHPELAVGLVGLGNIYLGKGDLERAQAAFGRALRIDEKALGVQNVAAVGPLAGLGAVLLAQGRAREAIPMLERVIQNSAGPTAAPATGSRRWGRAKPRWPECSG